MATTYKITSYSEWEPTKDNFEFKKAAQNKRGGVNIRFNYKNSRLYLRTPKMRIPFGLSSGYGTPDKGWNVQMNFDKDNVAAQEFLDKCKQFDKMMVDVAMENAYEWGLTGARSIVPDRKVIEERYQKMVKYSKYPKGHAKEGEPNPDWPGTLKVNFAETLPSTDADPSKGTPAQTTQFSTELYSSDKKAIPVCAENIPKNCSATALIFGNGYSIPRGSFGVSWKAAQMMVFPMGGLPRGECLVDADAEDLDTNEQFGFGDMDKEVEAETKPSTTVSCEEVEDEEVSAEADDVEEETAEPEPPVVAVKSRKTATLKKK